MSIEQKSNTGTWIVLASIIFFVLGWSAGAHVEQGNLEPVPVPIYVDEHVETLAEEIARELAWHHHLTLEIEAAVRSEAQMLRRHIDSACRKW